MVDQTLIINPVLSTKIPLAVTARGSVPLSLQNISGSHTRILGRRNFQLAVKSVSSIAVMFCAGRMSSSGEVNSANFTLTGCAIEISGVTTPITFSGANSVSMTAGQTVVSDYIPVSLVKGQTFYMRSMMDAPTNYPTDAKIALDDNTIAYDPTLDGAGTGQLYGTGALTLPTGGSNNVSALAPVLVIGYVDNNTTVYIGIGDSIAESGADQGSAASQTPGAQNGGWFRRFANRKGVAYSCYTVSGKTVASMVPTSGTTFLNAMLPYHSCAIHQLGTNDISGSTFSTMTANYSSIYSNILTKLTGIQWLAQTTILPHVTSTDGNTTTTNQTPNTGFAANGLRDQLNFWFRSKSIAGGLPVVIDASSTVEYPSDRNRWNLRTWTSTLTSAYTPNVFFNTNDLPEMGEGVIINPASPSAQSTSVITFSGTASPFGLQTVISPSTANQSNGATVAATYAGDGLHPSALILDQFLVPVLLNNTPFA